MTKQVARAAASSGSKSRSGAVSRPDAPTDIVSFGGINHSTLRRAGLSIQLPSRLDDSFNGGGQKQGFPWQE